MQPDGKRAQPFGPAIKTGYILPGRPRAARAYDFIRPAILAGPGIALIAIFLLWPLVWIVGMSFTRWNGYGLISWDGLGTWSALLGDPVFQAALRNTLIWIALSGTVPIVLGFGLAIVFQKAARIAGAAARAVAVLPLLLPPAVAAVTWSIVYNSDYGPLNGILGAIGLPQPEWLADSRVAFWALFVIELWSCVGFSVLIFSAAIRSIDRTYFDLARVEGATFRDELRLILLPACKRGAALAVVVTVVISSQVFDLLAIVTNVVNGTLMLPLDMYDRVFLGGPNVSEGIAEAAIQVGIGAILAGFAFWLSRDHQGMSDGGEGLKPRTTVVGTVLAVAAGFLLLLPLIWDVTASLSSGVQAILQPTTMSWPPSFSSFTTAWNSGIGSGLWQSAAIGGIVVVITLLVSLPAAFALSDRHVNRFVVAVVMGAIVLTLLQPGEAYLIPLYYLLVQLQLGDTVTGLVLAEVARELPFAILLFWIFIKALPADVLGAAELEVSRGFHMLFRVVSPMTAPIAAAAAVWVFVTSWSDATLPNILLSNSSLATAPVALKTFAGVHDTEFNLMAAGTLLLVLPVIIILLVAYSPASRGLQRAGKGLLT